VESAPLPLRSNELCSGGVHRIKFQRGPYLVHGMYILMKLHAMCQFTVMSRAVNRCRLEDLDMRLRTS
jgi:hypothetical protein